MPQPQEQSCSRKILSAGWPFAPESRRVKSTPGRASAFFHSLGAEHKATQCAEEQEEMFHMSIVSAGGVCICGPPGTQLTALSAPDLEWLYGSDREWRAYAHVR